jgi:hypothetical protein
MTEPQTGQRKLTWTDEAGNYILTGLNPGTYQLETSLVGFRTDVREPVLVTAGKTLRVNVSLVIALPESAGAEVASNRAAGSGLPQNLQARAAQMPARTGAQGMDGMPTEGATGNGEGSNIRFSEGAPSGVSPEAETTLVETDPSASAANSLLLSGGTGVTASTPGDDESRMRQRFEGRPNRMQFPAAPGFGGGEGPMEMGQMGSMGGGRGGGDWTRRRAQINRIRGNVSEQYGNSALNARPYPLNVASSPQIPSYTERLGIAFGGPLSIPKIYHGKDKTSFFVNYQMQRGRTPFDSFATVPTAAERGGDFSHAAIASGPLAGTVPTIYDPLSNPLGPRTPFAGNQIPSSRFEPAAVGLLKFIPLPNLPGLVQNFHLQEAVPNSNDRVMARIGQQISAKDSFNVFYSFNSSRSESVSSYPALTSHTTVRGQNVNLGETHTFGPHLINNVLVNFNRQRNYSVNPFAFQQDVAGNLGIQGISTDPFNWGVPLTQFTNFTALNDMIPSLTRNQTWRFSDFVIWNAGKHNMRFGGEFRRVQRNSLTDPNARGTFTFSGYTTSDFTSQGLPVPHTGFDFADFLLGLPQTTSVRFGTSANYLGSWVVAGFFQDDWRFSSHLTFNYGLRFEHFAPFTEQYGHLADLSFGPGFSNATVVTGQSPGSLPNSLLRPDGRNISPRFGLAYRPSVKHSLVFRAGYGVFFDGSVYSRLVTNLESQPPFAQASTLVTSPQLPLTLQNGFPAIGPNILTNTYAVDPNFRTPYAQTWSASLEDQIFRNVILSVGYVGTKGTKLDLLLAPYQAASGNPQLALQNALAFTYETSGAASIYNGLQVGLRRQFHGGLSFSANYTFSKSIDNAASVGGAGRTVAQNYLDLQAERGLSSFDMRHRLLINHTYEFPFGDRKRWLNHGGALAYVVGNWQVSGTTMIQSGTPYTAQVLGNLSNRGGAAIFNLRADATGQPVRPAGFTPTTQEFFNAAAFALPPAGQFGDAGRDTIPGPGTVNFNMSLDRFITLSREKGLRADFRVAVNNIFNTPNFSGLSTVVNAQAFGWITSAKAMRALTFSVRLRF